jgi:hypothetical protein
MDKYFLVGMLLTMFISLYYMIWLTIPSDEGINENTLKSIIKGMMPFISTNSELTSHGFSPLLNDPRIMKKLIETFTPYYDRLNRLSKTILLNFAYGLFLIIPINTDNFKDDKTHMEVFWGLYLLIIFWCWISSKLQWKKIDKEIEEKFDKAKKNYNNDIYNDISIITKAAIKINSSLKI